MQRSAVPPPDARRLLWWGLQAMAFTAALWEENLKRGISDLDWFADQTISLLSLPPEARYLSSKDHLRPQISYLCPSILEMYDSLHLKSRFKILLSFEPELNMWEFDQVNAPTLPSCPSNVRSNFWVSVSQRWTIPVWVPVAKYWPPSLDQQTEATRSSSTL